MDKERVIAGSWSAASVLAGAALQVSGYINLWLGAWLGLSAIGSFAFVFRPEWGRIRFPRGVVESPTHIELSEAITWMAFSSAWGREFRALQLANTGALDDRALMTRAAELVTFALRNREQLIVAGGFAGDSLTPIPQTTWQSVRLVASLDDTGRWHFDPTPNAGVDQYAMRELLSQESRIVDWVQFKKEYPTIHSDADRNRREGIARARANGVSESLITLVLEHTPAHFVPQVPVSGQPLPHLGPAENGKMTAGSTISRKPLSASEEATQATAGFLARHVEGFEALVVELETDSPSKARLLEIQRRCEALYSAVKAHLTANRGRFGNELLRFLGAHPTEAFDNSDDWVEARFSPWAKASRSARHLRDFIRELGMVTDLPSVEAVRASVAARLQSAEGERVKKCLASLTEDGQRFLDLFCLSELPMRPELPETWLANSVYQAGEALAQQRVLTRRDTADGKYRFCLTDATGRVWNDSGRKAPPVVQCVDIDGHAVHGTGASGSGARSRY